MATSLNSANIDPLISASYSADDETDVLSPTGVYREGTHIDSKTADLAAKVFSIDPDSESYYDPSTFAEIKENQCHEVLEKFDDSLVKYEICDENLKYIAKRPANLLAICAKVIEFFKRGVFPEDIEHSWTRKLIVEQIFLENSNLVEESAAFLGSDFLKQKILPSHDAVLQKLLKSRAEHLTKIRNMILKICEGSAETMSPGSRSEKCFNILRNSASWVKNVMKVAKISSGCFFHNLQHICDGDNKGGMHIIKTGMTIRKELAKNDRTNVLYAEIDLPKKGPKVSTFFPPNIDTKTKLVNLLSQSTLIGFNKGTNACLHVVSKDDLEGGSEEDLYINIFMAKNKVSINTAFPVFEMFNYINDDPVNEFSLTIDGVSHSLTIQGGAYPETCKLFCETEDYHYYDASEAFKGVSVFLKVPK